MKKIQIPKAQDWVSCKERLPEEGVDDRNKFIVAVRSKYEWEENWNIDYYIAVWKPKSVRKYPKHDGKRVITYLFDFYEDIDEGQCIEVTHWREIPEMKDLNGDVLNLSRTTWEYGVIE